MYVCAIISAVLFIATTTSGQHDFHASVAELNVNAQNHSLELSLHIFIDDLEMALAENGFDSLYIATSKESPLADSLINSYIQEHFYVDIMNEEIVFDFLGREISDDLMGLWCYFEAVDVNTNFSSLLMHNSILLDQFDDQRNICKVYKSGDQKHMLFARGREDAEFNF